ncbi:MAG: hypoxanthine phosphoribosyltransferase [Tissierellia bacterium]|nr:hypoxanthine phosphoribosyltransferase [Tissierellia bacterium]
MKKIEQVVFTKEEINKRIRELGEEITNDYKGRELVVVSLLRGSFIFTADLVREIDLKVNIDFMTTSSYLNGEESTGNVEIIQDIRTDIAGKDVLIVDDIIDSGYTLKSVYNILKDRNPNSLKSCVMLNKPSRRKVEMDVEYIGYDIDDLFIVGYGLNYGDFYRNVPHIFAFVDAE